MFIQETIRHRIIECLLANRLTRSYHNEWQLAQVIRVCRQAPSLSAAGRRLFAVTRQRKQTPNDADRLRKYLAKFGLDWAGLAP